ncbi:MAG TPA: CDC27 family protein [Phycisphaerales bacterium]|nr:CDC27 family protein [Phycisphaerales bacterium]
MSRIAQLEKLHAADPRDADVLYMLAQENAKLGDARAAVEWYDRCIATDPEYHYAYYHKARSQEVLGEHPQAIETLRAGLARAETARNAKAVGEISAYIESLGG